MSVLGWLGKVLRGDGAEAPPAWAPRPAGPPPRPGRVVALSEEAEAAVLRAARASPGGVRRHRLPTALQERILDFLRTGAGLHQLERELAASGVWQAPLRFHVHQVTGLPAMPFEAHTRLLVAVGTFDPSRPGWGGGYWDRGLAGLRGEREQAFDLAAVLEVVEATGTPADLAARPLLGGWRGLAAALPVEALVGWFRENPLVLAEALGARELPEDRPGWPPYSDPRPAALTLIEAMTAPPALLHEALWDLALGDAAGHRAAAQRCLEELEGTSQRLREAITHPRQAARAEAASWLARRGESEAAPALRAQVGKERSELAREAQLTALESLGEDLQEFFDPAELTRAAYRKLPKLERRLPEWLVPEVLPQVRWASGAAVDPAALRYLLARSHKLRSPEPGAGLRRWMGRVNSGDRRRLGECLLECWIRADETLESSIRDKGLLAVVAACCGAEVVAPARSYLRRWYGQRAPQCKELLRMLGWVDAPEATQLVLQVAARFRTRGIQRVAEEVARDLAERRGWSREQLADRLIPTGGLEPDGTLALDYGPRTLAAFLDEDVELMIRDEQGRLRRAAPRPRKADDQDRAETARKSFSRARGIVRRTLQGETRRLYVAMASERTWALVAWRRDLVEHPIVGRLVQRLVWELLGRDGGRLVRVDGEGTLRDVAAQPVEAAPGDRLRLAHGSRLSLADQAAWAKAFDAAALRPALAQFRFAEGVPPADERQDDGWHGCRGVVLGTYALRAVARKLGYQRGPTGDGGYVHDYRKALPELGLEVVLEHSGLRLPEDEDREVALVALRFMPTPEAGAPERWGPPLALEEVPGVLLHEAIADARAIAARGEPDEGWEARIR